MVGRLSSKAIPVLRQHHRYTAGLHQVTYPVHPRTLQARTAFAGVRHLLNNLKTLADRVLSQRLHLLAQGVARLGLLLGRHSGVEDSPPRTVTIGVLHALLSLHDLIHLRLWVVGLAEVVGALSTAFSIVEVPVRSPFGQLAVLLAPVGSAL